MTGAAEPYNERVFGKPINLQVQNKTRQAMYVQHGIQRINIATVAMEKQ